MFKLHFDMWSEVKILFTQLPFTVRMKNLFYFVKENVKINVVAFNLNLSIDFTQVKVYDYQAYEVFIQTSGELFLTACGWNVLKF